MKTKINFVVIDVYFQLLLLLLLLFSYFVYKKNKKKKERTNEQFFHKQIARFCSTYLIEFYS